jgi:hypothetical protein
MCNLHRNALADSVQNPKACSEGTSVGFDPFVFLGHARPMDVRVAPHQQRATIPAQLPPLLSIDTGDAAQADAAEGLN